MGSAIDEKYKSVCRVCVLQWAELQDIFATHMKGMELAQMLTICTGNAITPDDGLPAVICSGCLVNLEIAYDFREQCRNSELELRTLLTIDGDMLVKREKSEAADDVDTADAAGVNLPEAMKNESVPCDIDVVESNPPGGSAAQIVDVSWSSSSQRINEANTRKRLRCNVCDKTFDGPYKLRRHANLHNSDGKPFECTTCYRRFQTEGHLMRHQVTHSMEMSQSLQDSIKTDGPFKCRECDKEFAKQESLAAHMRMHTKHLNAATGIFKCDICSKVFSHRNNLSRHMRTHKNGKRYACSMERCLRKFSTGGQLIDHLNSHKEVRPHVCEICHKAFRQSCTLKDHLRTHNGETPFLCSLCGKAFNNSSNLRQHTIRHEGSKPYACDECPSRFSCKGGLKSHMMTHTGLRPYTCDSCGSSFTKQYSLVKHKRIHSGERPYSCEMCEMRFTSSDHVKRHMRTHTGEKPYKCKFCTRAFAQTNDLVKHLRSHLGTNTYQCPDCSQAFRLQAELRQHSKMHFVKCETSATSAMDAPSAIVVSSEDVIEITNEQMEAIEKSGNIVQLINIESGDAQIGGQSIIIKPGQIIDASAIDAGTQFIVQSLNGDKITVESGNIQQMQSLNVGKINQLC